MKDYLRRNWWLYLVLILACLSSPILQKLTNTFVVSFPSSVATWHFLGIPLLAAFIITVMSVRCRRYDYAAMIFFWIIMLVSPYIVFAVLYGGFLLVDLWFGEILLLSIPGALAFLLSIIAYRMLNGTTKEDQHMKDYLRRNWWLYLIMLLACAALTVIHEITGKPVLSPPSFIYIWYVAVIPVVTAACATVIGARRARFALAPHITVFVLMVLWPFINDIIQGSGIGLGEPPSVLLIFAVIPVIESLILSGIAYAIVAARRRGHAER